MKMAFLSSSDILNFEKSTLFSYQIIRFVRLHVCVIFLFFCCYNELYDYTRTTCVHERRFVTHQFYFFQLEFVKFLEVIEVQFKK